MNSHQIEIQERDLRKILLDDDTDQEVLLTYFEVDDSDPFNPALKLRKNVLVIKEDGLGFGVRSSVLSLANSWKRRSRLKHYRKMIKRKPKPLCLISEGDSWFQHPLIVDTIDNLSNRFAIYSLGAAGDELTNMYRVNEYLPALESQKAKGLLLSGGGNDILGKFGNYISGDQSESDVIRYLKNSYYDKVEDIINLFKGIYDQIFDYNPAIFIFTHGYDYVIPGEGKSAKYLGHPMEQCQIVDQSEKNRIIRIVIDHFNNRMIELSKNYNNVQFVDMRNSVHSDQWADEIHPTKEGYLNVARRFEDRINAVLI